MVVGRVLAFYKRALRRNVYTVQAVQTSFIMGLGDTLSQVFIESPEIPHDFRRTLRFASIGFCLGPVLQKWYGVLDKVVGTERNFSNLVKKVTIDQLIMAPGMLAIFLSTLTLLEGGGFVEIREKLNQKYWEILVNSYKLWPAVQFITFKLPINYRVLFVQTIALGWNTYLAWAVNSSKKKKKIAH